MKLKIDLTDPALFGKDAAEDEDADIFDGYVLDREESAEFASPRHRIKVVRAYKGEGKSALLRLTANKVSGAAEEETPIVVRATGPTLSPALREADHDEWVRGWHQAILRLIASEIGSRIGFPYKGDALDLREEAERNGFRSASLVSAVASRLTVSVEAKGIKVSASAKGVANPEKTLQRWQKKAPAVWLFVDDIDFNFENTKAFQLKTVAFFYAVRQITNLIPDIYFRLSIRPNIWAILKREYESLSHIEGYMLDLRWTTSQMLSLLANRVSGYLRYSGQNEEAARILNLGPDERHLALMELVFESRMPWGETSRPPHVVLHTLSKHRPRWAVELSRIAGARAKGRRSAIIAHSDIVSELPEFGRRRIEDTVAEFKTQCPQVDELLAAFERQQDHFTTDTLLKTIDNRVLQGVHPRIVGVPGEATARDVAHFLFQIGFIYGRRERPDGSYAHVTFAEDPGLLRVRTNLDGGMSWEVHPVFRQVLDLYDPDYGPRR